MTEMTIEQLANHWHMTERNVRNLERKGIAVRGPLGGFDVVESDHKLFAQLRGLDRSRQLKADLILRQTQRVELQLRERAHELLTRDEASRIFLTWWAHTWHAVQGGISQLFYRIEADDATRRQICMEVSEHIRGELILARAAVAERLAPPEFKEHLDHLLGDLGIEQPEDESLQ